MEELDYKQDIVQSRTGNVGSSDAKMLRQIAELKSIPKSAMKRMAIIKGLIENPNITTSAMRYGDFIENAVYAHLCESDSRWKSNPCITSKKYSRKNCGCITHVDFMLQDDEKKTLTIGECKATKLSFEQTREEYKYQILHHYLLCEEYAQELGDYKLKIVLCHYDTNDVDLSAPFEFDPSRLTVKPQRLLDRLAKNYNLGDAMDIVDEYLETLDFYAEDDEIDGRYLPVEVQKQFEVMTTMVNEIKAREDAINDFKARLYEFMVKKNIKSIKSEEGWSVTRVDETTVTSFDAKKFMEDFTAEHPRRAEKLKAKYAKATSKKGFVTIKIKKNNKD